MTTSPATKSIGLEPLAVDLRRAAAVLESLASALAQKISKLQWRGPAADTFRADAKHQQALLGQAVSVARQLAARIEQLIEEAKHAEAQLKTDEATLEKDLMGQIKDLEAVARDYHTTVAALLATNPAIAHQLVQEGDTYQSLQHQLTTLGAV